MAKGAEKIRAWRTEVGLTQEEAAHRVPVHMGTWSSWEQGRKRPSIEQIAKLAVMTSTSEHALSMHDFIETAEEAAERRERRKAS